MFHTRVFSCLPRRSEMTYLRDLKVSRQIVGGLCGLAAVACASSPPLLPANAIAKGSAIFELGKPLFFIRPTGAFVEGRACRRRLSTLLSPEHVRLEDISPAGEVRHVADAYLPLLSVKFTERCEHYHAAVNWRPLPGDTIWVCFERGRGCRYHPAN